MTDISNNVLSSLTLEDLAARVVVEHQQVGMMMSGYFASGIVPRMVLDPATQGKGNEMIQAVVLQPAFQQFHKDCPRNFGMVVDSAQKNDLPMATALQYYVKSKLYFACAVAIAQFIDGVVPNLERTYGVTELPIENFSGPGSGRDSNSNIDQQSNTAMVSVTLKDLELFELHYVPHQRHSFFINGAFQTIENYNFGEFANHTILQCRTTGVVLDLTLGQLTGKIKPGIFRSYQEYEASFPGRIIKKFTAGLEKFHQHVGLVFATTTTNPDFSPAQFGERVIRQVTKGKAKSPYCESCFGVASGKEKLKRCTGCQQVVYCSKHCQLLHWKEHKESCAGRKAANGKTRKEQD